MAEQQQQQQRRKKGRRNKEKEVEWQERVVQIRRVTKVVKGVKTSVSALSS